MHIQKRRGLRGGLQYTDEARAKMVEAAAQKTGRTFGQALLRVLHGKADYSLFEDGGRTILIRGSTGKAEVALLD